MKKRTLKRNAAKNQKSGKTDDLFAQMSEEVLEIGELLAALASGFTVSVAMYGESTCEKYKIYCDGRDDDGQPIFKTLSTTPGLTPSDLEITNIKWKLSVVNAAEYFRALNAANEAAEIKSEGVHSESQV